MRDQELGAARTRAERSEGTTREANRGMKPKEEEEEEEEEG